MCGAPLDYLPTMVNRMSPRHQALARARSPVPIPTSGGKPLPPKPVGQRSTTKAPVRSGPSQAIPNNPVVLGG